VDECYSWAAFQPFPAPPFQPRSSAVGLSYPFAFRLLLGPSPQPGLGQSEPSLQQQQHQHEHQHRAAVPADVALFHPRDEERSLLQLARIAAREREVGPLLGGWCFVGLLGAVCLSVCRGVAQRAAVQAIGRFCFSQQQNTSFLESLMFAANLGFFTRRCCWRVIFLRLSVAGVPGSSTS